MRQLFVIGAIFIQLLGYFSAEAKAGLPSFVDLTKKAPLSVSSPFHQDAPADITSISYFTGTAFKSRNLRTLQAAEGWYGQPLPVLFRANEVFTFYSAPLFSPLTRLILYPNHYFW